MGRQGFEQLVEQHDLQLAMAFQQAQMHANGMHIVMPRHIQHTVQQAAPLRPGDRHIEIARSLDRVLGQQGIAVMTVGVNGILPVGKVAPHAVGEEFVL